MIYRSDGQEAWTLYLQNLAACVLVARQDALGRIPAWVGDVPDVPAHSDEQNRSGRGLDAPNASATRQGIPLSGDPVYDQPLPSLPNPTQTNL